MRVGSASQPTRASSAAAACDEVDTMSLLELHGAADSSASGFGMTRFGIDYYSTFVRLLCFEDVPVHNRLGVRDFFSPGKRIHLLGVGAGCYGRSALGNAAVLVYNDLLGDRAHGGFQADLAIASGER